MSEEWPELKPLDKPVENKKLRRLGWLIGGGAAEEWLDGHTYQYNPNPAVREALEIIVELDKPKEEPIQHSTKYCPCPECTVKRA